jgi:hypothetical protein
MIGFCPHGCGGDSFYNAWGIHANAMCCHCLKLFRVFFEDGKPGPLARTLTDEEQADEDKASSYSLSDKPAKWGFPT